MFSSVFASPNGMPQGTERALDAMLKINHSGRL